MRTGKAALLRNPALVVGIAAAVMATGVCPWLLGGSQYAYDIVQTAMAFALFTVAWDFLCGLTGEVSFGYSLFVGIAAYGTALAQTSWGLPPTVAVLVGTAFGTLAGLLLGVLTLRQTGAVFAMVTMAVQLTFHRTLFIWSGVFGGEEGVSVTKPLFSNASVQYWFTAAIAVVGLVLALILRQTRFGRQLRASGGDLRVGMASGVPVPWVRVAGAAFSALLASIGGSLLVMQNMLANHEMAGDSLAGIVFLLAVVGGTGTLIGPWLAAVIYICGLRQSLVFLGRAEPVVVFGILLAAVWFFPDGIAKALSRLRLRKHAADIRERP